MSNQQTGFVSYPFLAVSDMTETTRYYCDVLGFTYAWGDEFIAAVVREGLIIRFMDNSDLAKEVQGHEAWDGHMLWIEVPDVESLHAEHQKKGAKIVMELETQPWSFREYTVEDCNGYQLRIGQWVNEDDNEPDE